VPPRIEFKSVSKSFQSGGQTVAAVREVALSVVPGEIITLVGPSGCGKSTLLNMTAGLFGPSSGTVAYDGRPIAGINRRVGYMTQSDHLLPWRSVADNIAAPLQIAGMAKVEMARRTEALIELVGLSGFARSYPSQLSGGMRKRAALARLLAYDPDTLLMDEPFGALDAQLRLRLQAELRRLCKKFSKTVLFVTHDLDEAVALGDRVAVFSGRPGTIVRTVQVTLPADRDLFRLRFDPDFTRICASLWETMAPALAAKEAE
jgi:NitT/TauT family transport system ATP-binding protein